MTIQEYEDHLKNYISILRDVEANEDTLRGAQNAFDYALGITKDYVLEATFKLDITELQDDKFYAVEIDLDKIKPDIANHIFLKMKEAVEGRGIELLAVPKQMKIREVEKRIMANDKRIFESLR